MRVGRQEAGTCRRRAWSRGAELKFRASEKQEVSQKRGGDRLVVAVKTREHSHTAFQGGAASRSEALTGCWCDLCHICSLCTLNSMKTGTISVTHFSELPVLSKS